MNQLTQTPIENVVDTLRSEMENLAQGILALKAHGYFNDDIRDPANDGEMFANIMLAFRCAEDAKMRLGKVLQAHNGGTSKYDGPDAGAPADDTSEPSTPQIGPSEPTSDPSQENPA